MHLAVEDAAVARCQPYNRQRGVVADAGGPVDLIARSMTSRRPPAGPPDRDQVARLRRRYRSTPPFASSLAWSISLRD